MQESFEKDYNKDLIEILNIKSKDIFFNFKQNNIYAKLLKKEETIIKLKAKIDIIIKEINIIFTLVKELKNTGYKFPNNDFKKINRIFLVFLKRKDRQILMIN